jgi:exodeoxyribonuclease VII large subunit
MAKSSNKNPVQLTFQQYRLRAEAASAQAESPIEQPVLTVTELTTLVRSAIQIYLPPKVLVTGEVSNLSRPRSGHVYFTLKDEDSQIGCAIWGSRFEKMRLKFELADGMAVLVEGHVDVFGQRGQYQLYVEKIQPYGLGELELAFRQLKAKLEREGLFDPAHKKAIPPFPFSIALITSMTGAAIRDVLRTLTRRWPVGRVMIYPVPVQGDGAADKIAQALDDVNANADRLGGVDVLILARGGGSLEDLWAFNEETVARAIYRSNIPVVTGVGHEIDVTIADLAADLRAATPTAAAEQVAPMLNEVRLDLRRSHQRLRRPVVQAIASCRSELQGLTRRGMFVHPIVLVGRPAQEVDELSTRLQRLMINKTHRSKSQLSMLELALSKISPHVLVHRAGGIVAERIQQLRYEIKTFLQRKDELLDREEMLLSAYGPAKSLPKRRDELAALEMRLAAGQVRCQRDSACDLDHLAARLTGCDYNRVLKRGFSITRRAEDNKIIGSLSMVKSGGPVITELTDGRFVSVVTDLEKPARHEPADGGSDNQ